MDWKDCPQVEEVPGKMGGRPVIKVRESSRKRCSSKRNKAARPNRRKKIFQPSRSTPSGPSALTPRNETAADAVKVLLDENLPHRMRHHFPHHDVYTAAYAGFAGFSNGQLLDAAESAGFEVLISGDRTLDHEQNLSKRKLALILLSAVNWIVIEPHLPRSHRPWNGSTAGLLYARRSRRATTIAQN